MFRPGVCIDIPPERSARYKDGHTIPCPILSGPDQDVYRACGVGHFSIEQIFNGEGSSEFSGHSRDLGEQVLDSCRPPERTPVVGPWRASGEFVVTQGRAIRLAYASQWCGSDPAPDLSLPLDSRLASGRPAGVAGGVARTRRGTGKRKDTLEPRPDGCRVAGAPTWDRTRDPRLVRAVLFR